MEPSKSEIADRFGVGLDSALLAKKLAPTLTCPVCKQAVALDMLPPEMRGRLILGLRVRQMRDDRGLTQEEVADEVGCSRVMVTLIETGQRDMSLKLARRLAKLFGVSLDDLTAGME